MTIVLSGLDGLLSQLRQDLTPAIAAATLAVGHEVSNVMEQYPGTTDANNSANKRYYIRGVGGFSRSLRGVRQTSSSQTLNRRWRVRPAGGTKTIVENDASYGPFVQAAERQTAAMQRIGWTTDQQAVDKVEASGVAKHIAEQAIKHTLGV